MSYHTGPVIGVMDSMHHNAFKALADDGFGNLVAVSYLPYRRASEEESERLGLPVNFTFKDGPYKAAIDFAQQGLL